MSNIFKLTINFVLIACWLGSVAADYKNECLQAHNKYRKKHHSPPMVIDAEQQASAQNYANTLANRNGDLQHGRFGENLHMGYENKLNGADPVDSWYKEVSKYNYNNPVFEKATGHFTQVVWKNSKKLGCAYARNGKKIYVVGRYYPYGNYKGQFTENVLRP